MPQEQETVSRTEQSEKTVLRTHLRQQTWGEQCRVRRRCEVDGSGSGSNVFPSLTEKSHLHHKLPVLADKTGTGVRRPVQGHRGTDKKLCWF